MSASLMLHSRATSAASPSGRVIIALPLTTSLSEGFCLGLASGKMLTSGSTPALTLMTMLESTASPSGLLTTTEYM